MTQIYRSRGESSSAESTDTLGRVKQLILGRQGRTLVFPKSFFGEPAWDMLLELYVSGREGRATAVTDLSRASDQPQTTALRWIAILEQHQYLSRSPDPSDARRVLVSATSKAVAAVERMYDLNWADSTDVGPAREHSKSVQIFYQGIGFIEAGTVSEGGRAIGVLTGVKQMQIGRKKRHAVFPRSFFSEPAWDMLLEAYVSFQEGYELAVTDLCIASGEPQSTALRWIAILERHDYLSRSQDPSDGRRILVHATDKTLNSIERLFTLYSASRVFVDPSAFPAFKA